MPFKKDREPKISVSNIGEEMNEISVELDIDGKKYLISFVPKVSVKEVL